MSTAPASQDSSGSLTNLVCRVLASLSSPMLDELCRDAATGRLRLRGALEKVFEHRCGAQSALERLRFLFFAAPVVRRMVIGTANLDGRVGRTDITFADVKSWLEWLDAMDPLCARMIDLRYFAGLGVKESAVLLDLPPAVIVRDLRFARAWLRIKDCP